jgi:hypothetical protein
VIVIGPRPSDRLDEGRFADTSRLKAKQRATNSDVIGAMGQGSGNASTARISPHSRGAELAPAAVAARLLWRRRARSLSHSQYAAARRATSGV